MKLFNRLPALLVAALVAVAGRRIISPQICRIRPRPTLASMP